MGSFHPSPNWRRLIKTDAHVHDSVFISFGKFELEWNKPWIIYSNKYKAYSDCGVLKVCSASLSAVRSRVAWIVPGSLNSLTQLIRRANSSPTVPTIWDSTSPTSHGHIRWTYEMKNVIFNIILISIKAKK